MQNLWICYEHNVYINIKTEFNDVNYIGVSKWIIYVIIDEISEHAFKIIIQNFRSCLSLNHI